MNSCRTCGQSPAPYMTGGPLLTLEEQVEIQVIHESFRGEFHTGHLPTRLLRLPIHYYCFLHKPDDARVDLEADRPIPRSLWERLDD